MPKTQKWSCSIKEELCTWESFINKAFSKLRCTEQNFEISKENLRKAKESIKKEITVSERDYIKVTLMQKIQSQTTKNSGKTVILSHVKNCDPLTDNIEDLTIKATMK